VDQLGKIWLEVPSSKAWLEIVGGKPDVDYVKFVVKPVGEEAALALWFDPTAFNSEPESEKMRQSITFNQEKVVVPDGTAIGLDSRGENPDKTHWRHFGVLSEGAEYDNASNTEAAFFDKIIDTACRVPYPEHNVH